MAKANPFELNLFRAIEVFVAVVETRHVTQAAEMLGITQSAASQQLQSLERALGVQVIDRATRPAQLTKAGIALHKRAMTILGEVERLRAEVRQIGAVPLPLLRVAMLASIATTLCPALAALARDRFGIPELSLSAGLAADHQSLLRSRSTDLAITSDTLFEIEGLTRYPIMTEQYLLVTPKGFAGPLEDLEALSEKLPLVRFSRDTTVGARTDQHLSRLRISLPRSIEGDRASIVMAPVAAGMGFALLTSSLLLDGLAEGMQIDVHKPPFPGFSREIALVTRARELGDLPEAFAATSAQVLTSAIDARLPHLPAASYTLGDGLGEGGLGRTWVWAARPPANRLHQKCRWKRFGLQSPLRCDLSGRKTRKIGSPKMNDRRLNAVAEDQTDWSAEAIVARRERYYAASQRKFVPYATPQIFERGSYQYLWDEKGNKYTDLLGMNLCISVGHAHPAVVAAVQNQAAKLTHCTTMFYHPVPAHYAEELAATMPPGHDWVVHFTNSGAEAADLALLMARGYTGNIDFLSLRTGYHGATFGAQAMTGIAAFRHDVPQLGGVTFVPEPNQYRGIFGRGVDPYLDEVERAIQASTSGRVAGMMIETVQGYGGIIPMPQSYIAGAFERIRAAGGLGIIDEVQSGVGRTGTAFWAFEDHDVVPDIVIMAKGIGNGIPLGAVVAKREIAEPMADKFLFSHLWRQSGRHGGRPRRPQSHRRGRLAGKRPDRRHGSEGETGRSSAKVRSDRRCARRRADAGHRTGQGPAHQRTRRGHHRQSVRREPKARGDCQQVRPSPQRHPHVPALVPVDGGTWTTLQRPSTAALPRFERDEPVRK